MPVPQVGLVRAAGAGGNKLERFLVTDPPPIPQRSQFLPSKASHCSVWLFHSSWLCGHHTVAWNPFPPGL